MKKIFIFMIFIFAIFGVTACNSNPSEIDISYDEQIAMPTNLSITNKVLSWTAVENAKAYYVYADGEEVDKVRTNSFDFSNLTGDRIIFTVSTQAPRGMQDSAHSVSIAYVANKTAEISSMKLAVSNSKLGFSEDFAEELVNKGMLTSEFNAMVDGMNDFGENMDDVENIQDFYDAVSDMMENMDNVEAFISALVKFSLPEYINDEIAMIEYNISFYESYKIEDPQSAEYYQERIDNLELEIEMYEGLLDTIENSSDAAIKSFVFVMDYIKRIENMITQDLITNIANFQNVDEVSDLNVNELVLIKEEMVTILQETMPSSTDVILVIETMYSMSDAMDEIANVTLPENLSSEKAAGSILMSLEAFILFLDNFDQEYFQSIKDLGSENLSEYMLSAEVGLLTVIYFDDFKEENQNLLDQISDIYTDEEKEAMIEDYKLTIIDLFEEQGLDTTDLDLSFYSFESLMSFEILMEEAFDNFLDAFVEADGELFRAIARVAEINEPYINDVYMDDYDEYQYLNTIATMKMIHEVLNLANAVIEDLDIEDYTLMIDFYINMIELYLVQMSTMTPYAMNPLQSTTLIDSFSTFITNSSEEQLELMQNIVAFLVDGERLLNYSTEYDNTFDNDYEKASDDGDEFAFIFFANQYLDFMNSGNRQLIDDLLVELDILFESNDVEYLVLIDDIDVRVKAVLDYMDDNLGSIKDYDAGNLTVAQRERISEIQEDISNLLED